MKNYDLPTVSESMTLEEIKSARSRMTIDGRNDPEHPYFCARHPEHAAWVAYVGELAAREVTLEADAKAAEQAAALDACEEVDQGATTEDQIKTLEMTPGFLDGTLRRSDRPRHDAILAARDALYERGVEEADDVEPDA